MKNTDKLLREKLTSDFAPANTLNQSIIKQAKEIQTMKRKSFQTRATAFAAAGILIFGSATAYAAYRFLTPAQVAEKVTRGTQLLEAFESEEAVYVNETQITNGYRVTFLGMTTGDRLKEHVNDKTGLEDKRTYAVTAIEKEDGSPMPQVGDENYQTFCISPLLLGKTFMEVNNGILNAGVSSFVQDGIQYELLECDNLEIFAKTGVYLGVVKNFGEETRAFSYDEETGIYKRNPDYDKINALFQLPLDASKADEEAAAQYLKQALEKKTEENYAMDAENGSPEKWMENVLLAEDSDKPEWSFLKENAKEDVEALQTIKPDAEGYVDYKTKDEESTNHSYVGDWAYTTGTEVVMGCSSDGTLGGTSAYTFTRNADGSFTIRYYTAIMEE